MLPKVAQWNVDVVLKQRVEEAPVYGYGYIR